MNLSQSLDEIISKQAVVFADQIKQAAAFAAKEKVCQLLSHTYRECLQNYDKSISV